MSRVTIGDIYNDVNDTTYFRALCIADIEVVPRKIIEMIIEKCERDKQLGRGWENEANSIISYAEELLKQFEEDKDEN